VEVNALQPLWTWGRIQAANDAADSGARARKYLVDDTANAIRTRVVQLVMGIRLTTRLLSIAADVQNALKEADTRVQKSLKANDGEITPEDRYRIEIFRSQLTQRVADGERALRVARVGLAATLAMEPDQLQLRDDPLPDTAQIRSPDLPAALADAEKQRPDLKALDNGIQAKEADVTASRAELYPQIGLVGQFAYSRAPGRDTITNPYIGDYFNALTIGAALGIKQNLSFWTVITRTNKKEAELDTLRRQRTGAVRLIHVEVETAVADLNAAITKREASAKAVAAGRSWFRSATPELRSGGGRRARPHRRLPGLRRGPVWRCPGDLRPPGGAGAPGAGHRPSAAGPRLELPDALRPQRGCSASASFTPDVPGAGVATPASPSCPSALICAWRMSGSGRRSKSTKSA
jgi:outer membrane protein TolC